MAHGKTSELEQLLKEHDLYKSHKAIWKYLQDSFEGGEAYKRGNYLRRYINEVTSDYNDRLKHTPLDNHCRSVISVYNSFLFRKPIERDFANLTEDEVLPFLQDADLDGRDLDSFMKDVATWSAVYGHCWVMIVKPDTNAATHADELAQEVRPYVNLLTPLSVIDWQWSRKPNGVYELAYMKYIEERRGNLITIKEWVPDAIKTTVIDTKNKTMDSQVIEVNELGRIPAVLAYAQRSATRAIGVSDINDIADEQKFIYNLNSELEQGIRLESHPSLVIEADGSDGDSKIGTGAGSIIEITDLNSDNKPYILDSSSAGAASIIATQNKTVMAIDKMANTGAVRSTEVSALSGVAMETEFQLLNARLSEKAAYLALAEEQMWRIFAAYIPKAFDGSIKYPDSFNIQDTKNEFSQLSTAASATQSKTVKQEIDRRIMELLDADPDSINTAENNDAE